MEKTENELHTLELKHSSLQNDYETVLSDLNLKNKILEDFEKKGKSLTDESQKFLTQIKQLNDKNTRLQKKTMELQEAIQDDKKTQLIKDKEFENVKKENIRLESDVNSKVKKIEQLLEDIAKIKNSYKTQKLAKESNNENENKKNEKMNLEIKKVEKQKNELLNIIKKQSQLIDVLKRQKANIQSSFL